jgi:hypothetical protein
LNNEEISLFPSMEINYGTRAEASMPATSSCPDPGHIKTLVFDKVVIDGMMLITG